MEKPWKLEKKMMEHATARKQILEKNNTKHTETNTTTPVKSNQQPPENLEQKTRDNMQHGQKQPHHNTTQSWDPFPKKNLDDCF